MKTISKHMLKSMLPWMVFVLITFCSYSTIATPQGLSTSEPLMDQVTKTDGDVIKADKKKSQEKVNQPADKPESSNSESLELNYLKFNVEQFYNSDVQEITELPESEFPYLHFNVEQLDEINPKSLDELPDHLEPYQYLKFDVNAYSSQDLGKLLTPEDLPIKSAEKN